MDSPCTDRQATTHGISVRLPNGARITSTHACKLLLPGLPPAAAEAHIFPDLTSGPLLSIGQLCDNDCTATFTKHAVNITHQDRSVLEGQRNHHTGLWYVALQPNAPTPATPPGFAAHQALSAYQTSTLPELVQFLHAACFSPSTSTFLQAIQAGYLTTWPGLTAPIVAKYLPKSIATAKGHMDQQRKNLRSTKPKQETESHTNADDQPQPDDVGHSADVAFLSILDAAEETGKMYSDITGRFPVQSSRGHKYIFVLYDYDSNAILVEPLKSRAATEILRAFDVLHQRLRHAGRTPTLHILDNEASNLLKAHLRQANLSFQLVPPHIHRRNAAERAIRTFKNHFVAGLASTDKRFPLHLWDRLLPQAELTLNLLRPARLNPKLSAYAILHGIFDFNSTPLAPPGTKILIHEKPQVRPSWSPHGEEGWYLGPALDHYRCYRVYATATAAERISDTVAFFPEQTVLPYCSSADAAMIAARQLVAALQHPTPAAPIAPPDTTQLQALQNLAAIFQAAIPVPTMPTDKLQPTTAQPNSAPLPGVRMAVPKQTVTTHAQLPVPVPATGLPGRTRTYTSPMLRPGVPEKVVTIPPLPAPEQPSHTIVPGQPHRYPTRHRRATAHHALTLDPQPLLLPHIIDPFPHLANAVIDPDTGQSREYRDLIRDPATKAIWAKSFANELGRLAQGVGGRIKGTNTCFFIPHHVVPKNKTVTYGRIVVELRPQKEEVERTRLTVGGDLINYPGVVSTETADITTSKVLFNSVVSTPKSEFMVIDIHNFYLNTPMPTFEYMRLHISLIPDEIIAEYNLMPLVHNGYIYIEIQKGMYGLPQAGILANNLLRQRLAKHGYFPCPHTPGLWKHITRPILFTLVVDDFGVQYTGNANALHLIQALKQDYTISLDWQGKLYCGITLKWDYINRTVDLSMPGYVQATLHKFQHPLPNRQTDAPHSYNAPTYGVVNQTPLPLDTSEKLPPTEITRIQQVVGTLLFYARAVDSTLRVALGTIAAAQTKSTQATAEAVTQLLNYCASHPEATVRYHASDMVLHVHSDASYLTEPEARSRAGGHFFMSNVPSASPTPHNGAVHTVCGILRHVMASASEAELGALFVNGKEATVLRQTLQDMGWPQPPTPMQTDNSTASGIVNHTVKQHKSRAMDMRFYWIRDRTDQKQFHIFWAPGNLNLGDYFTKHHAPSHHRSMRPYYLHTLDSPRFLPTQTSLLELRGCVNPGSVRTSQRRQMQSAIPRLRAQ
jgi:hypothetical protein